jgi:hypothetical protein
MQPYLFPYLGYFQLINAVDKFIFYDDVSFIKQGWINRNRIIADGKDMFFTVPVENISSNKKINETKISGANYVKWRKKFLHSLKQNYVHAPFYNSVEMMIEKVFDAEYYFINEIAEASILEITKYLGIEVDTERSGQYKNNNFKGSERVIDICVKEKADHYINVPGGVDLYDKKVFEAKGIKLSFIKSEPIIYKQFENDFIPNLSIIDVLMFNSVNDAKELIKNYSLN